MSAWGKLDYKELSATATVTLASANIVIANYPQFLLSTNVSVGDTLLIGAANVKYKVAYLLGNTNIILDTPFTGANASGQHLAVQQSPKSQHTLGWTANATYLIGPDSTRNVYGVDKVEIGVTGANGVKANGVSHVGWVSYQTYVTANSATNGVHNNSIRRKSEVLVAMSKNFNANVSGVGAGVGVLDAPDNTFFPNS
jgi:hypothetical protein